MKNKHIYILGTGYSHDGSSCLLKDGKICIAIEKERITRRKHDGYNDTDTIQYCLDAEGITMNEVAFVVQNSAGYDPATNYFNGERVFAKYSDIPLYTISHHMAHAYSAVGTCKFKNNFNIMVIDGSGSSYDQCIDLTSNPPDQLIEAIPHLFYEKDSFYHYANGEMQTLFKDFSEFGLALKNKDKYTISKHSIGGAYEMFSKYCFNNLDDTGKLMGLAPYGRDGVIDKSLFELQNGRFFVNYDSVNSFQSPCRSYVELRKNFQYYANIAYWVQKETERAILYIINSRLEENNSGNLCYAGGVALNAVANAKIQGVLKVQNLYMQPAAGDNGISIGCAYYGWLEILKNNRILHNSSVFFGKPYTDNYVTLAINRYRIHTSLEMKLKIDEFFLELAHLKTDIALSGTVFEIDIETVGIYQLKFQGDKLMIVYGIDSFPTSAMKIGPESFLKGIQNKSYFELLISTGQLQITNLKELAIVFSAINFEDVYNKTIFSNDSASKLCQPITYRRMQNKSLEIASLLAGGKIIGLFQGGSEFGPRALGNRSILADPRIKNVRDFINSKIKFREDFRPFAPAVLKDDLLTYFKNGYDSPYMISVNEINESWKDSLISVIHEDNSSRVQTVTRGWNESFYQILSEFKRLTGLPMLLNTSLNKKGMPIVETPEQALDLFLSTNLDYLILETYIIEKSHSSFSKILPLNPTSKSSTV